MSRVCPQRFIEGDFAPKKEENNKSMERYVRSVHYELLPDAIW